MSRYPNFIDATVSDYGAPAPEPRPYLQWLGWLTVIAGCAWCALKFFGVIA